MTRPDLGCPMQFLTSLFGGSGNEALTTVVALGIVLLLIVIGLWGLKVLMRVTSGMGRGRSRRLAVVEAVAVDTRRRLVIIRRDNVEHLVLTGGPQDVVVETGIPVERPVLPRRNDGRPAEATKKPAAPPAGKARPILPNTTEPKSKPSEPAVANGSATQAGGADRLRDLGRPAGQRASASLRHTGLMRPVSRMEPATAPAPGDKQEAPPPDSVKRQV